MLHTKKFKEIDKNYLKFQETDKFHRLTESKIQIMQMMRMEGFQGALKTRKNCLKVILQFA